MTEPLKPEKPVAPPAEPPKPVPCPFRCKNGVLVSEAGAFLGVCPVKEHKK